MSNKLIRVFEFEKLTLHPDALGRCIVKPQLDKLYEFNDKHGNKYFTGIRDGIRFKNFVGVIQVGGLSIEILPKADRKVNKESFETEAMDWQKALLRMLALTRRIKVNASSEASLKKRHNSLLDLYFELYLNEVELLLRNGLVKKYIAREGNLKKLKGRIDFPHQLRKNIVHKERFYTHHQVYDQDHLINQILLRGLVILESIVNGKLRDKVARLCLHFPEITDNPITEKDFTNLKLSRKTTNYQDALSMAKMIILNYSPDIQGGDQQMLALMFDMNKLWEEYVYRMLLRVKQSEWSVSYQNSKYFWEKKTIRPDLVITDRESKKVRYIIDTKWKVIKANDPSDDDLKQMYAYNMYWGNERSMLLYPGSNQEKESFGEFHIGRVEPNECKVGFVNVLSDDGSLDYGIGDKIMGKFME